MKFRVNVAIAVLAMASGFVAAPVEKVYAQGFFERLFNPSSRSRQRDRVYREGDRVYRQGDRVYRQGDRGSFKRKSAADARKVRVEGPKYYTYRPDKLVNASFSSLVEIDTASNDPTSVPVAVTTPFADASVHLTSLRIRTLESVADAVKAHYLKNPAFVWVDGDTVNDKARTAMAALAGANKFGLSPTDYEVPMPAGSDDAAEREKALIEFEIQLSTKVLTYVLDSKRGRVDPNRISGYHDFKRKTVDLGLVMSIIASTDGIASYLESRSPRNVQFLALADELARLRAADEVERVEIAKGTFLKPGQSTPEMSNVIAAIRLRGSKPLLSEHAVALSNYQGGDVYSPERVALVRDFQRESGLKPDGIVGKATIRALVGESQKNKIRKIELAMERARWLSPELGSRYVFINQPAYTASYMEDGKDPLTMRVVIGLKTHQTNFFMDKIETVEYNPYWGVPRSIIINEMLPNLYEDPSYLDRLGYEVTTASGQPIASADVDWYDVGENQAPINVRQPPGRRNALGELKILFPNKHAIYMHDTPAKGLFKRDRRAYSHGCVRLQDPRAMAAAVLGKTKSYVSRRIAEGENVADRVTADIPVYVAYFTAWPNAQGTVEYFDDMYDRDMYLTRALEKTSMSRHTS